MRRTTTGGARSDAVAAEARGIVRRAAGDTAGRTIAAQIKRATENLSYGADAWRVREAWYSRAGSWSAAALDDLRRRDAAWREREAPRADPSALAARVAAMRRLLGRLQREVEALEAEVERALGGGSRDA